MYLKDFCDANANIAACRCDYFAFCYGNAARVKGKRIVRAGVKLNNFAAPYFDKATDADFGFTQNGAYFHIYIAPNVAHLKISSLSPIA